jgi:hypothetical protein
MSEWIREHWILTFIIVMFFTYGFFTTIEAFLTVVNNYLACKYKRSIKEEK